MSVVPSAARKKSLANAAMRFHTKLMEGGPNLEYLFQERGLTEETVRRFQLGEVPHGDVDYPDHAGWISVPYLTPTGFVDLRFRNPDPEGKPKYKGLTGATLRMFNPSAILQANETIVAAEGEFDAMILNQVGLHAIGIPGASAWRKPFELAIHGFDNIIICEDGDDGGAGKGLTGAILKGLDWAKAVRFEGTDVNDFYLEHGAQALRDKVLAPVREDEKEEAEVDEYDEYC